MERNSVFLNSNPVCLVRINIILANFLEYFHEILQSVKSEVRTVPQLEQPIFFYTFLDYYSLIILIKWNILTIWVT